MTNSPKAALLEERIRAYLNEIESPDRTLDYAALPCDVLLVVQAINDWSNGALAEGADLRLSYACADPCGATEEDVLQLVERSRTDRAVLSPVSAFNLNDKDELCYSKLQSAYRLTPHRGGSRRDAVMIAEAQPVDDADLAMKLWLDASVEDCMAYLEHQMQTHELALEPPERETTRNILRNALMNISVAQAWSTIWRAVQNAAALSTRQYYNRAKAARTIPKKIDAFITASLTSKQPLQAYDRIADNPMGAVQTLMNTRFGITERTTGAQARQIFMEQAAAAPRRRQEEDEGEDDWIELHRVELYLRSGELSELDRFVLNSQVDVRLLAGPELDESTGLYVAALAMSSWYGFDPLPFLAEIAVYFGASAVTPEIIRKAQEQAKAEGIKGHIYHGHLRAVSAAVAASRLPDSVRREAEAMLDAPAPDLADACRLLKAAQPESNVVGLCWRGIEGTKDEWTSDGIIACGTFSTRYAALGDRYLPPARPIDLVAAAATGKTDALGAALAASIVNVTACPPEEAEPLLRALIKHLTALAEQFRN
ncbi:MAG: hypothetical protein OEL20_05245 [Sulfuritalea sp.]|nr:hypothetical protein [Sulfuritalea sp.]